MPDPDLFLDAYAGLVSQRAGDEGRDSSRLLRTMRVLAALESQAVPDQRIWDAADINKVTWKAYEDILQRTHLSAPTAAFETNRLKRLTSYPKRYLADTALALVLADIRLDDLRFSPNLAGQFLESFVMQQLRPQVDLVGGQLTARHLRWLRDELGDRFSQGYVVHTGGDTYPLADRVWAIPVSLLAGLTAAPPRGASDHAPPGGTTPQ